MGQGAASSTPARRPGPIARRFIKAGNRAHTFIYRLGLGRKMGKMQLILLTTTGRKTGRPHTVPLGAVPEGDGWVVIGSFGGADIDPSWWLNLVSNPLATIQLRNQSVTVRMQEITDPAERERIWRTVVQTMRGYAAYTKKTSRVIPLGLLRPVAGAS